MIVLIPAYEPDNRLLTLVGSLLAAAPDVRVIVVDDGSGPAYRQVFDAARRRGCTVIGHPGNRGKGYALKSGFRYIDQMHHGEDVVCADSDGQHSVVDILAVAARVRVCGHLVLGSRQFTGAVPLRSKVGNTVTRVLFAVSSGCDIRDTQTGLRGYPYAMLEWLRRVPGDRFEYEMNVLLQARLAGYQVEETAIATIYVNQHASSHFRPVIDSVRVLTPLLKFSASSLLAFGIDVVTFLAVYAMTGSLLPAAISARALSSTVNFLVNRRLVFAGLRSRPLQPAAVRYWGLVGVLLAANYGLIALLAGWGVALLPAKLVTEAVLFGASYLAQRRFVFARPARQRAEAGPVLDAAGRVGRRRWVTNQAGADRDARPPSVPAR
jgi:glycosyltransferase involved in cell wall biosynthesis